MANINILSTGVYHPEHSVSNEYYINHFKKQGKDISTLLKNAGRNTRYISQSIDENSLTMAVNASQRALEAANLTGEKIDLIIFSSGTPEFLAPANSIKLHRLIGGSSSAVTYDMNANCVGMMVAIQQASHVMKSSDNCNYALIVGSEQMNRFSRHTDEYTWTNFGDAACAVILKKEEGANSGFQDAVFHVNSSRENLMLFPECGMSNIYNDKLSEDKKRILWRGENASRGFKLASFLITSLLQRNNKSIDKIKKFFISQVSLENIQYLANELNVDIEKFEFIGDRYGYTGTSSPFVALHYAIKQNEIQCGDDIVFWTVGAGYESCAMLWKY
jgi:3-oxoacyl-[acyl-carrier-protein] synthase-3